MGGGEGGGGGQVEELEGGGEEGLMREKGGCGRDMEIGWEYSRTERHAKDV